MQQQPLAFTLVKTVVSARDEGRVLSPALATAWDLLHTELSPAHRVIASEVKWAPNHQEDLRFVIEGVRKQFEKDPDLESEFLAFLAEVEPFGEGENDSSILPVVIGITSGSSIAPPVGEVSFAFTGTEGVAEGGNELIFQELPVKQAEHIPASASENVQPAFAEEPEVSAQETDASPSETSTELEFVQETDTSPTETSTALEFVQETDASPSDTSTELEFVQETDASPTANSTAPEKELLEVESISESSPDQSHEIDLQVAQSEVQALHSTPTAEQTVAVAEHGSKALITYWPILAGVMLLTALSVGLWFFSGPSEVDTSASQEVEAPFQAQTDSATMVESQLLEDPNDAEELNIVEEALSEQPSFTYSLASIARMSHLVDSFRLVGDFASALIEQKNLTDRLAKTNSAPREKAQAYAQLAILYASQENVLQAIVEQRSSLDYARTAYAKTDPALGRSHLMLASFYTESGELHMARAHLQQARRIFGETQELVSPTDLKKSELIAKKLEKAS